MFEKRFLAAVILGGVLHVPSSAQAGTFTPLLSLGSGSGAAVPLSGLVPVGSTLFGTSQQGGVYTTGTVYQFSPKSHHETPIYSFSEFPLGAGFAPGLGGLSTAGAIAYGTTTTGIGGNGSVYKLDLRSGTLNLLYGFHGGQGSLRAPIAVTPAQGLLYGTASGGSVVNNVFNGGTFSVDPVTGTYALVHAFTGAADGGGPASALVGYTGLLFGTTTVGGASNNGAIFEIDPRTGVQRVVYSFSGASDGSDPLTLLSVSGAIYGVAKSGGAGGSGTIFSIDPATGIERTMHSFSGTDGSAPIGALTLAGNYLYGTASAGGPHNQGVLFRLNIKTNALSVLHGFTGKQDGGTPTGSLAFEHGTLYGTTALGGTYAGGTIFQYVP